MPTADPIRAASVIHDLSFFVDAADAGERESKPKGKLSWSIFHYTSRNDKLLIGIALFLAAASGVGMPMFSFLFGDLMNVLGGAPVEGAHGPEFYSLMLVYLGIAVFGAVTIGGICMEWVGENTVRKARYEYLKAVLRQEMGWFDTFDSGTLASRLNSNCIQIRDGVSLKICQLAQAICQFIAGYILGFIRGWKMTLVLTATLPLLALSGALMALAMSRSAATTQKQYSAAGSVAEEVIGAIRTVVAFGAEERSIRRYNRRTEQACQSGVKGGLFSGLGMGVTFFIVFASYSLGFWYGGKLISEELRKGCVTADCFNGGKALSVFFGVVFGAFSLGQAGPPFSALMLAGSAATDLLQLTERQSFINPEDAGGTQNVPLAGEIEFKDVAFAYPTRQGMPVFGKINLRIRAGEKVALVGPSGCGKSTTVQLVQRFYDPSAGEVYIDGRPVRSYNLKWLRDQMSLVSQEPRLFARSIAENIRDGREGATLGEVEEAAKNANAMGFIATFPEGLDTFVGEGGSQLSGGQKQRIAIARAMLRDPAILILDEATSALDNQSERVVQETLDKVVAAKKRTTIIIAHRLSTIRNADRIIVFDNTNGTGSIVAEEGTHDELMAMPDGLYQSLVNAQQMGVAPAPKRDWSHATSQLSHISRNNSSVSRLDRILRHGSKRSSASMMGVTELDGVIVSDPIKEGKATGQNEDITVPSFWRVLSLLRPQWKGCILGVIGAIGCGLVFPVYAILFAQFIGVYFRSSEDGIMSGSRYYALLFLALGGASLIFSTLQKWASEFVGQQVVLALRKMTFRSIIHKEIGWFDFPEHSTGMLSQLLAADSLLVKGWVGDNLVLSLQNAVTLIAAIVISFIASPQLAAVCLASFMIMLPAVMLEARIMSGKDKDLEGDAQTSAFILNESIANIRIVTAYNLQERLLQSFAQVLDSDLKDGRRRAFVGGFFYGLSQGLQFFANALQLWYGTKLMKEGKIASIDRMLRATTALLLAGIGIGQTMVMMTDAGKAKAAAKRIYAVVDRRSRIDASNTAGVELEAMDGKIEVSNVSFRYPLRPDARVYKSITFTVQPGETVALVGASGCGKSTIIQLLERFYDIDAGEGIIKLDGKDIKSCRLRSLRAAMGLVGQEPVLFNTSIAENIRYGKPDATLEEIEEAARAANALDFIKSFPDGFDQSVGKLGSQLSGGQKQRIAIARAIVRNPKILLLDEATSALDSESERIVQQALDALMSSAQRRTTLVIAHRLSTIRNADKIVVFANLYNEGSSIVEVGTHNELISIEQGVYRGLVRAAERTAAKHETKD